MAILFIVLEPLTGQVFEPIFYGQSTGLSPFAVLVSALFWTWLWGPVGLLLSTPLTVCLVVLGRYVEHLEFLDVLFGDRPALTPVQNFYQRILAGDSEEVLGHAELILQQCSLSSYYDEVVLKALELAARDAARGVLTAQQKGAMRAALTELVADLSDRSDAVTGATGEGEESACSPLPMGPAPEALPAAWTREGAVLCVAGRGFLDEAAAAILAQILEKRGLGVRTVPSPRRPPCGSAGSRRAGAHRLRGLPGARRRADPPAPPDPPAEGRVPACRSCSACGSPRTVGRTASPAGRGAPRGRRAGGIAARGGRGYPGGRAGGRGGG